MRKQIKRANITMALAAVTLSAVIGCAPLAASTVESEEAGDETAAETSAISLFRPVEIRENDGTEILRVPVDETGYNDKYLDAAERGCGSCHDDLASQHPATALNVHPNEDIEFTSLTVSSCIDCHTVMSGYLSDNCNLGSVIHSVHRDIEDADCWSCHYASNGSSEMQMWDEVKYNYLHGIIPVADQSTVSATFDWNQDLTIPVDSYFPLSKDWDGASIIGIDPTLEGDALEAELQRVWDEWTIAVHGDGVAEEKTWTLDELIAEFPSEQLILKDHCAENPFGGSMITAVNVKGINVNHLYEAAGADLTQGGYVTFENATGRNSSEYLADLVPTYLVYEIDGKKLDLCNGYPVRLMTAYQPGPAQTKNITGFAFVNDGSEPYFTPKTEGHPNEDAATEDQFISTNCPNVGTFDVQEGQVIKVGEPFTLSGYADAFTHNITAVEISLDNGATWEEYSTDGAKVDTFVNGNYTFTPQEPGAYVISVRAKSDYEPTAVSPKAWKVMLNAK